MKNVKLLALLVAVFHLSIVSAADVFVRYGADGTGDGSSWDSPLTFNQFRTLFNGSFEAGTTFYLSAGTYKITTKLTTTNNFTLKGGYPTTLTGTSVPTPDGKTPTVFKGDGNIIGLLEIDMSSTTTYANDPVVIDFVDFTNAQGAGGAADGALKVNNSQNLTVGNCNFYGNVSTARGITAYLVNTTARFVDCTFHSNSAATYGAALKLNATNGTKGKTTLERCLIYENAASGYPTYGTAIYVMNAKYLQIVNSSIFANTSETSGKHRKNGAIYLATKNNSNKFANQLMVLNSTIAGNNHHQIYQEGVLNLQVANSIICCPTDNANESNAAIFCGTIDSEESFVSGGYNVLGSVVTGASDDTSAATSEATPTLQETDCQKNNEGLYYNFNRTFGYGKDNVRYETIQSPIAPNGGMSVSDTETLATTWSIPAAVDLSVDNDASIRVGTKPGAFAPLTKAITIDQYATFYSDYGYFMPENVEGAIVTSTGDNTTVALDYNFLAGEFVPGGTPLVLKGTAGDYTLKMKKAGDSSTKTDGNLLLGTENEAMTTSDLVSAKFYKLSNGSNGIGFYWSAEDGAAFMNGANKAYLVLPGSVSARFISLDGTTTILNVNSQPTNGSDNWYTMQGVVVKQPLSRGHYIHNGKKIIIR